MNFLITAGGTREYIDPVRFISNASSGKTGLAIAQAAIKSNHKVTLITAPTGQKAPEEIKVVNVETAAQMFEAVKKHFCKCDCLVMAAAVSDYTPVRIAANKIKKSDKLLTIKLRPTVDILKWAAKHKRQGQLVVGFALEDKALRKRAEKKLVEKKLDMIIANSPAAIGASESNVQIKCSPGKWLRLGKAPKTVTAKKIIRLIEQLFTHCY